MSIANLLQTLGIQAVPPVPPVYSCEGTENTHEKQPSTTRTPCTPGKDREADNNPRRASPDAVLLELARQLRVSPASLWAMMDDDDIEATANGEYTPAYLLAYFRLKQETGELQADDTPEPTRQPESRPGHVELMQAWKPAHDDLINHLMACSACHAPRARYCTDGAELRRAYLESYQNAQQPE